MPAPKPRVVLFAGAYHAAPCMGAFEEALKKHDFISRAFKLSSAGDGSKDLRDDEIHMQQDIESVLAEGEDVLLIVHSYAGFPCSGVLRGMDKASREAAGKKNGIVGVIYMAAFIPQKGDSVLKCIGGKWKPWMVADNEEYLLDTRDRHHTFYGDCSEEISKKACEALLPHSVKSFKTEVHETSWADHSYNGKRAYIRCLQDAALPLEAQDHMLANSGVNWHVVTLDSSHSPFLSKPEELAAAVSNTHEAFSTVITGEEDAQPFLADVLVRDGLIAQVGEPGTIESANARRVDASGLYLSPGFIDMHAHSDLYLITNPVHEAKISQGCTTEVVGQDGISYAPVRTKEQLRAIRNQIAGWNGNPSDEDCQTKHVDTGIFEWQTVGDYLDCLERNKTATNVAMLVPQGNLRLLACGPNDTPASPAEIEDQVKLLREAITQGAVGMSSGLTYTPGMYASTSELATLCKALADEFPGTYYAPHHRSYGFKALESYDEMIGLGKNTGCPIHLTHATMNFSENKGRAPELLKMVDGALGCGVDVTLDTYPYLPGCTTLAALLPSWASAGGPDETLKRLDDAELREKIRVAIEVTGCDGGHGIPTNWDEIQIGSVQHESLNGYAGRRVAEVAQSVGKSAIEVFYDILVKDRLATSCLMHIGHEENVRLIMQHEKHMSGSDAILHGETLHPRAYGTFTRYLGHYARDLGMFTIPQMMAHLTSRPAKRLNVYPFRGHIGVGSAADLVLFDPETIADMATFEKPKLTSKGIKFVLVNGVVAVDGGKLTEARGGHVLRRKKDGSVGSGSV